MVHHVPSLGRLPTAHCLCLKPHETGGQESGNSRTTAVFDQSEECWTYKYVSGFLPVSFFHMSTDDGNYYMPPRQSVFVFDAGTFAVELL